MSDVGNIAGTGIVALPRTANAAPAKVAETSDATSFSSTLAAASSGAASLAPVTKSDPIVGLVTQYLDPQGGIVSQVPSTQALTYLRAGLTADGLTRKHDVGHASILA